jgi:hypothetical protein
MNHIKIMLCGNFIGFDTKVPQQAYRLVFSAILFLLLEACQPWGPAQLAGTPTVEQTRFPPGQTFPVSPTPLLSPTERSTGFTSATPAQSPQVIDRPLDWQMLSLTGEALLAPFAFDGRWLVTLSPSPSSRPNQAVYLLYARDIEDLPNRPRRVIFALSEGLLPAEFETGSGFEAAGGRAALLLVTAISDDPRGYQLWLFELETGQARLVKQSERTLLPSLPAIALSDDWLVLKDLDAQGRDCFEIYPLEDGPAPAPICAPAEFPASRFQFPVLSGSILAYIQYDQDQICPAIHRMDLRSGEERIYRPENCQLGLMLAASEDLVVWMEVLPDGSLRLRGRDAAGLPLDQERSQWGGQRVCGRRIYSLGEKDIGTVELRGWSPGEPVEVLHRYRPAASEALDSSTPDLALPEYNLLDFRCGNDWLIFYHTGTGPAILGAKDGR